MINDNPENLPVPSPAEPAPAEEHILPPEAATPPHWIETLLRIGLGEEILRIGTHLMVIVAVVMVIILSPSFFPASSETLAAQSALAAGPNPTPTPPASVTSPPSVNGLAYPGIFRRAMLHTIIPTRPRTDIVKYTVVQGDTLFGIAEKFGIKPQTVLWGNYNILLDNPHSLQPGQELIILPVDGTYYEWHAGDGLNGVAKYFGVTPEVIVNYPGNHLNPDEIGDYAAPNIKPGTKLIIPGGKRDFVSWSAPLGVTRDNPASARVLGPGACDPVSGGAVGYGNFIWPAANHYLSGFDYSPESNHWGIDIAGHEGMGVFAVDAGVVVYAGWNEYGYGNMIILDHGNGWQSLYAHLSAIYVGCGQSVGQGDAIGAIGNTGRSSGAHLHFELMTSSYKPNPWDFLPPP